MGPACLQVVVKVPAGILDQMGVAASTADWIGSDFQMASFWTRSSVSGFLYDKEDLTIRSLCHSDLGPAGHYRPIVR